MKNTWFALSGLLLLSEMISVFGKRDPFRYQHLPFNGSAPEQPYFLDSACFGVKSVIYEISSPKEFLPTVTKAMLEKCKDISRAQLKVCKGPFGDTTYFGEGAMDGYRLSLATSFSNATWDKKSKDWKYPPKDACVYKAISDVTPTGFGTVGDLFDIALLQVMVIFLLLSCNAGRFFLRPGTLKCFSFFENAASRRNPSENDKRKQYVELA